MKLDQIFEAKEIKLSKHRLMKMMTPYLDRLQHGKGENRRKMVKKHVKKLVGLTPSKALRRLPRGEWGDMMQPVRDSIKGLRETKNMFKDYAYYVADVEELTDRQECSKALEAAGYYVDNVIKHSDFEFTIVVTAPKGSAKDVEKIRNTIWKFNQGSECKVMRLEDADEHDKYL